jgi:uncharacterized membrane protein
MSAISLKTATLSALLGAAALGIAGAAAAAGSDKAMDKPAMEKCYGVNKAGKNDCASGDHSCAGQATKSMDKTAFVELPAGVCAKLGGGSLTKG